MRMQSKICVRRNKAEKKLVCEKNGMCLIDLKHVRTDGPLSRWMIKETKKAKQVASM